MGISIQDMTKILGCDCKTVYNVKKKWDESGNVARRPRTGLARLVRSESFVEALEGEITDDPSKSMRALAKEAGCDEKTIQNSIHKDFGLKSYIRGECQLLMMALKMCRVTRGTALVNWMKSNGSTVRLFSNMKAWTVDQTRNDRNDCWLAFDLGYVPPIMRTKHPASVMMLGVVASDDHIMEPFWFQTGFRLQAKDYLKVLKMVVTPWVRANFAGQRVIWQQDSAPAHKAKIMQQ